MKKNYKTINYEWLTQPTGDPFADVGGYVIKYLSEKYPDKDILEFIKLIADIYVKKWEGKINPFFLNSTITQPAFKGKRKIDETIKYFSSLIHETTSYKEGYCRISGQKTKLFKSGRDNTLLSGSGGFVNYHHSFQIGLMLSKEMLIRMFFIPFGSLFIGGRIGIIQSNNGSVNEFFVFQNCKENFANLAISASDGVLKSDYGIPANALFHFIDDLFTNKIKEVLDSLEDFAFTLYHFTNFGASPEISIYTLPSSAFRFYSTCQNATFRKDWQSFLCAHYRNAKFKNAKYNISSTAYELEKRGQIDKVEYSDYRTWRNIVLENLLNGKSLLKLFLNWGKRHKFPLSIVEIYQINIQHMKKETLNKIKELALFLTAGSEDAIKKNIRKLDGAKTAYDLRRFFLNNVTAKNYKDGAQEPIITVEELVYYLFPDDLSWKDVRDILLFAVYQELHAKNIRVAEELLSSDEENKDEDLENN